MTEYNLQAFYERGCKKPWLESELVTRLTKIGALDPTGSFPFFEHNALLAGGALRRTFLGQPLDSDFDFFFYKRDDMNRFIELLMLKGDWKKEQRDTNVTLTCGTDVVQCVEAALLLPADYKVAHDLPATLIDQFDFTLCQFATDGHTLVVGKHTLWDTARMRLVTHKITQPVASVRRLLKYTKQGFYACSGSIVSLLEQSKSIDLKKDNINYID